MRLNRNAMNLNAHESKKKCLVNIHQDRIIMSSENVDELLKTFEALELDTKEGYLIMDYSAFLSLDTFFDVHPHHELLKYNSPIHLVQ